MNKKIVAVVVVILVLIGGGTGYYLGVMKPHQEAVAKFNKVVEPIKQKNSALDKVISNVQTSLETKDLPFDVKTKSALESVLKQAKSDKKEIPKIPEKTNDINQLADKLATPVDYSKNETDLGTALQSFENSIKQNKQVTNPTSSFVVDRLKTISTVTGVQAATENNDPNENMNKAGGYTAAVYFTDSEVKEQIEGKDIVDKGTDAGGQVEVYKTIEDAKKRNDYLSAFDGTGMLNPGSHEICGTCVIRTSSKLTATQQNDLTNKMIEALTKL